MNVLCLWEWLTEEANWLTPLFGADGAANGFSDAVKRVERAPVKNPQRIKPAIDQNIEKHFPTTDIGVMSPYLQENEATISSLYFATLLKVFYASRKWFIRTFQMFIFGRYL